MTENVPLLLLTIFQNLLVFSETNKSKDTF